MPYVARGFAQPGELQKQFNRIAHIAVPGVVRWWHTFGNDWSGDPAIFFWVVLTNEASLPNRLRAVTTAFTNLITQRVDPLGQWGLIPYFTFRSQAEQDLLKDEVFE
jgi:hypothetical protein